MTSVDDLPRSALLAAWGGAALRGDVSIARAVRAVQGDDEPHGVELADDPLLRSCDDLPGLLASLSAAGTAGLRVVLPVPGDLTGLAGPGVVNVEALDAGECLLTVGGPPLALVPVVEAFGSAADTGHLVRWWVHDANVPPPESTSTGDVERTLREALAVATRQLDGLGLGDSSLGRAGADLAGRLSDVRYGAGPSAALPEELPARSRRLLDLAWRVHTIVELAGEDDGGAVSGWEATRRSRALEGLGAAARQAVVAALNATCSATALSSHDVTPTPGW
ncbi:MAG TPA: hypothetical protein VFL94_09595 [Actinomycetales bacterium]|nr:hypothetical protein [Actinomycetales bacterium]